MSCRNAGFSSFHTTVFNFEACIANASAAPLQFPRACTPDTLVSLEPGSLFHLHYAQLWSSLAFSGLFHLSPQLILHHFVSCSLTFASDDNMIWGQDNMNVEGFGSQRSLQIFTFSHYRSSTFSLEIRLLLRPIYSSMHNMDYFLFLLLRSSLEVPCFKDLMK